jgi:branched-chain amino acid transport system permease protein
VEIWYLYMAEILIFVVFAVSLNLLLGYAGQVSVAHAAFGAIGGFTVGYLVQNQRWNFVPATLVGMAVAFVVGIVLALPAMRLSVEFLILLTLGVSSVILGVFTTFKQLGGTFGLINLPVANLFGWSLRNPKDWLLPLGVVAMVVFVVSWRIGQSPYGRVLKGIREDGRATQALGKNVFRFKLVIFGVTSAMAGLAGALYASLLRLATPGAFGFSISLAIFAMVIFGGMANLWGSVFGAAVVTISEPVLERWVRLSPDKAGFTRLIIYGLVLIATMMLRPQGAIPEGASLRRWWRQRRDGSRVEMVSADQWVPEVAGAVPGDGAAAGVTAVPGDGAAANGRPPAAAPAAVRHQDDAHVGFASERDEVARESAWEAAPVVLKCRELSKRFGGIVAADDLNIELRKGTITALVGPNGAGKTTVFNLLTGFIPPDRGSVLLNGEELVGRQPDAVARMGMVRSWQDVRLFARLSCVDNVALGIPQQTGETLAGLFLVPGRANRVVRETNEKAIELLRFVGMHNFGDIPAGALSYGQSKLISLARLLATNAEVLLLDEPASGIDTQWVDTLLAMVESIRDEGRTICIVEHNLAVVGQLADHTYFMELGRITAEGTMHDLTGSARLAEAYFGTAV